MKNRIARLICRMRGHDERCTITVFIDLPLRAEHTHDCRRCLAINFSEEATRPEGPDMGLALTDQRALLN